jgi:hypothetical protein
MQRTLSERSLEKRTVCCVWGGLRKARDWVPLAKTKKKYGVTVFVLCVHCASCVDGICHRRPNTPATLGLSDCNASRKTREAFPSAKQLSQQPSGN